MHLDMKQADRRRVSLVALVSAIVVASTGLALLSSHHPSEMPLLPRCPLHQWTGLYCPGCGSTRALYELLHGDVPGALRMNGFFVLAMPLLAWSAVRWYRRAVLGQTPAAVPGAAWIGRVLAAAIIAFFVLRNIPAFAWLAPH